MLTRIPAAYRHRMKRLERTKLMTGDRNQSMGNSPKQNNDFDNIDITGMLTGQEKEAMNAEDAQALAIITARMAGNALSLMRNALATHSSRVIFNMPVEMSDHARCSMAIALNTAAETFAKIEERNTDAAHTFDIAVQRFGLMQEENAR